MIGLTQKAGKTASGEFSTEKAGQNRLCSTGYRIQHGIFGQYKEEVPDICANITKVPVLSFGGTKLN